MKLDLSQTFKNLDGTVISEKDVPFTLGLACARALATPIEGDEKLAGEKIVLRWKLAVKMQTGTEVELTPEEATDIRQRLTRVFHIAVAAQAFEMLNG